jgi:uncharacterized protein YegL
MARSELTDITFVLDRSGSMGTIKADTIGGFNQFLEDQKKAAGEALMTLVQFDDQYEVHYAGVPIAAVKSLNNDTFVPRGWTALYDAIGKTVVATGKRIASMPEAQRPGKVLIVIMTDGGENKSVEFVGEAGRLAVSELVKHQMDKYAWAFLFLGASLDAPKVAEGLGMGFNNAVAYTASGKGVQSVMRGVSRGTANLRSATGPVDNQNFTSAYMNPDDPPAKP